MPDQSPYRATCDRLKTVLETAYRQRGAKPGAASACFSVRRHDYFANRTMTVAKVAGRMQQHRRLVGAMLDRAVSDLPFCIVKPSGYVRQPGTKGVREFLSKKRVLMSCANALAIAPNVTAATVGEAN